MTLLSLEDGYKSFNDRVLLDGVTLTIGEEERVGLLGLNGSGKSTLLRILAGLDTIEEGKLVVQRGRTLGYLDQEPHLEPERTVREVARAGLGRREEVLARLDRLHEQLASAEQDTLDGLLKEQERLERELERLGGHDVEHLVESTLHSLGITDFQALCGSLSGGERRRVALARLLLGRPDLLLLDEPTNHLDAFVTDWLEDWFLKTRTPLLLVTHDRYFLDRVVDRIVELDRGKLVQYDGGYEDYLVQRAERLAREEQAEASRLNLLRRETAWMRRGPPARTTKAKARIKRYEDLRDDVPTELAADLQFAIPPGPRLGARVVKLTGVTKGFDGRTVVPALDLELQPGSRLGVIGPNGAGKTTLLRLVLGELEPDAGVVEVGETVRFMGIDQMRAELDPEKTVTEEVAGRNAVVAVGDRTVRVESYLTGFGFKAAAQQTPVGRLSGGEKNRVMLAKLLCAGGNVLVLDEPTNDLDLATLRALEEALLAFPGSLIVVSHDRWFLDRVATQILYLDEHGAARMHIGDVSSLLAEVRQERADAARKERTAAPAAPRKPKPSAPKPKRLTPWQEKELTEVEGKIEELEAEIARLDERLADPALYTSGAGTEAQEIQARRGEVETELRQRYERWEELEALR